MVIYKRYVKPMEMARDMKKLFLRAEFGPLWEPWEVDETPRKKFSTSYITVS